MSRALVLISLFCIILPVEALGQSALIDKGKNGVGFYLGYTRHDASATIGWPVDGVDSIITYESTFHDDFGIFGFNIIINGIADAGLSFGYNNVKPGYQIYTWSLGGEFIPIKETKGGHPISFSVSAAISLTIAEDMFNFDNGRFSYAIGGSVYKFFDPTAKLRLVPAIGIGFSEGESIPGTLLFSLGLGALLRISGDFQFMMTSSIGTQTDSSDSPFVIEESNYYYSINLGFMII